MTNTYGIRSQNRMRMSLTSNSRRLGEKDLTTDRKEAMLEEASVATMEGELSASCHWKRKVAAVSTMQMRSAYWTPVDQPYLVISQPPTSGPTSMGMRRTM